MVTPHVRTNINSFYQRTRLLANRQNRSISLHVRKLSFRALLEKKSRKQQLQVLQSIRSRRFTIPEGEDFSLEVIRKDRKR